MFGVSLRKFGLEWISVMVYYIFKKSYSYCFDVFSNKMVIKFCYFVEKLVIVSILNFYFDIFKYI